MRAKSLRATIIATSLCIAVTLPAFAAGLMGADAVAKREELMKSNGMTLKAMQSASGDEAVTYAQTLVDNFTQLADLWPEDSNTANTKALPAVWSDMETFKADLTAARTAAETLLATAQSGDMDAYAVDLKAMGAACGTCHKTFKAPN